MSLHTKYDILDNRLVIRRLNAGDKQCFEACYRFYYKGLCSFASRWVSLPVAEDIVQDTMLYIWENRDKLMEELSLKGLLFMIVRNKALDRSHPPKRPFAHPPAIGKNLRRPVRLPGFLPRDRTCTALPRGARATARADAPHLRDEPFPGYDPPTDRRRDGSVAPNRQLPHRPGPQGSRRRLKDYLPLIALFFEIPGNN